MSEEFNNQQNDQEQSSFKEKLKDIKVNRPAVISACMLLVAVIVVTAVSIASNRTKKNDVPLDTSKDTTQSDTVAPPKDTTSEQPKDTTSSTPDTTPSTPVEDKLPSFVSPVSGTVSKKHDPTLQVFSNTMNDYRVHLGLDIVTQESAPVYSAADGKIERIWEDTLMGYCIAIKHSGNCYTIYKNLAKTLPDGIAEGVSVRAGQIIASVGDSAMVEVAEEPHLHFEMTVADLAVDPLEYFDDKILESLKIDASHGE